MSSSDPPSPSTNNANGNPSPSADPPLSPGRDKATATRTFGPVAPLPVEWEHRSDRQPEKSILKKRKREKAKVPLVWDESNLVETSVGRGTRMKIEEADTPYLYPGDYSVEQSEDSDSSEDGEGTSAAQGPPELDWGALASKLEVEKRKQENGIPLVVNKEDADKKAADFKRRRKLHYNEGTVWKKNLGAKRESSTLKQKE
eukprot:TRINITY_DN2516_c0_g1_i1.p1 TRINITY_DN2516_c0_g1~~TRINITY_DN2516_c0_g1_i1.p1  ORF type:complete len:201 (-),score=60.50 TRINITY_DN2516_c0_g1_i1:167-769(-)